MDGYRWFQNGTKKLPRSEPAVSKIHFISVSPNGHTNGFKRHAFKILKDDGMNGVLVHYIGDETIACEFPHGNSKSERPFHRSCKSFLKSLPSYHESPENVYKN